MLTRIPGLMTSRLNVAPLGTARPRWLIGFCALSSVSSMIVSVSRAGAVLRYELVAGRAAVLEVRLPASGAAALVIGLLGTGGAVVKIMLPANGAVVLEEFMLRAEDQRITWLLKVSCPMFWVGYPKTDGLFLEGGRIATLGIRAKRVATLCQARVFDTIGRSKLH